MKKGRSKLVTRLSALLLALGIAFVPCINSLAISDGEYIDTLAYPLTTTNLDAVKNYIEFTTKYDDLYYRMSIKQPCYIYGYKDDRNFVVGSRIETSDECFDINFNTEYVGDDIVRAFDEQKSTGIPTLFSFFVNSSGSSSYSDEVIIPESTYTMLEDSEKSGYTVFHKVGSYVSILDGMTYTVSYVDSLGDESKKAYTHCLVDEYYMHDTVGTTLTVDEYNYYSSFDEDSEFYCADWLSHFSKIYVDDTVVKSVYDTLPDTSKNVNGTTEEVDIFTPQFENWYSKVIVTDVNISNGNCLKRYSGDYLFDSEIPNYMVFDSGKNYVGTVTSSDLDKLLSSDSRDLTEAPTFTCTASVLRMHGNPADGVYIGFRPIMNRSDDYLIDIIRTDNGGNTNVAFSGASEQGVLESLILLSEDTTLSFRLSTHLGLTYDVNVKVTGIGGVVDDEGEDPIDDEGEEVRIDENVPAPTVTFSDFSQPTTAEYITITMSSNTPAFLFLGDTRSAEALTSMDVVISQNGVYSYSARGINGKTTSGTISVNCFTRGTTTEAEVTETSEDDGVVYFDTDGDGGAGNALPQTGLTATVIVLVIALLTGGFVFIKLGGKKNETEV